MHALRLWVLGLWASGLLGFRVWGVGRGIWGFDARVRFQKLGFRITEVVAAPVVNFSVEVPSLQSFVLGFNANSHAARPVQNHPDDSDQ